MKIEYPLKLHTLELKNKSISYYAIEDLDLAVEILCEKSETHKNDFTHSPEDLCPYYGVLWSSAQVLCEYLQSEKLNGPILEIGCGLALPSIMLKSLGLNITASDFHPNVAELLSKNAILNNIEVPYIEMDWTKSIEHFEFKTIIGSDILYEGRHPKDLSQALANISPNIETIIIVDPGRGRHQLFIQQMQHLGFKSDIRNKKFDDIDHHIISFYK